MSPYGFWGYVVGGLIVGAPLCILTGVSIWLQWRSLRKHVSEVTAGQDRQIQRMLDNQTQQVVHLPTIQRILDAVNNASKTLDDAAASADAPANRVDALEDQP